LPADPARDTDRAAGARRLAAPALRLPFPVEPPPAVASPPPFASPLASAFASPSAFAGPEADFTARFGLRRCGRMLGRLPSTSLSPELGDLGSDKRLDMIAQRAPQRVLEPAKCSLSREDCQVPSFAP
jgi:hypothetical protein